MAEKRGQKFGRNKRRPSQSMQAVRTAANTERKKKRHAQRMLKASRKAAARTTTARMERRKDMDRFNAERKKKKEQEKQPRETFVVRYKDGRVSKF